MRKLLRRPSPAMLIASVALFAATAGVSYAAVTTPHDPSFTSRGVAFVPTSASYGVILPLTGANTSDLANHGMTLSGTHSVAVPTTGIYDLTLAGANTVHLVAGTRLNTVAGHTGADANCGATLGATLVSADA